MADGFGDFPTYPAGIEAVNLEFEVREGCFDAEKDFRFEPRPEEMELNVFRAGGMLQDGEDGGHCASEIVRVQCHSNVYLLCIAAFPIAKGWGFSETGDIRGGLQDDAKADGGGGGGIEEEEDRQEADELLG